MTDTRIANRETLAHVGKASSTNAGMATAKVETHSPKEGTIAALRRQILEIDEKLAIGKERCKVRIQESGLAHRRKQAEPRVDSENEQSSQSSNEAHLSENSDSDAGVNASAELRRREDDSVRITGTQTQAQMQPHKRTTVQGRLRTQSGMRRRRQGSKDKRYALSDRKGGHKAMLGASGRLGGSVRSIKERSIMQERCWVSPQTRARTIDNKCVAAKQLVDKLEQDLAHERQRTHELRQQIQEREHRLAQDDRLVEEIRKLREDYEVLVKSFKYSELIRQKQKTIIQQLSAELEKCTKASRVKSVKQPHHSKPHV